MELRAIGPEDLPALSGLLLELSGLPAEETAMARVCAAMGANPDYLLLGAFRDGELVGTVMGIVCLDLVGACRPFLVVENLIVGARFRRQGIARALLGALERLARQRDCHYVVLVSGPTRAAAHGLYAALGYAAAGVLGFKKYL